MLWVYGLTKESSKLSATTIFKRDKMHKKLLILLLLLFTVCTCGCVDDAAVMVINENLHDRTQELQAINAVQVETIKEMTRENCRVIDRGTINKISYCVFEYAPTGEQFILTYRPGSNGPMAMVPINTPID